MSYTLAHPLSETPPIRRCSEVCPDMIFVDYLLSADSVFGTVRNAMKELISLVVRTPDWESGALRSMPSPALPCYVTLETSSLPPVCASVSPTVKLGK